MLPGTDILSAAILLILVIDPFGNVPLVVSAMRNVPPQHRARVVLRECVAAYVILIAFMAGGQTFLRGGDDRRQRGARALDGARIVLPPAK